MDAAAEYLSLDEPDRSNHLWKYTPWRRVHPTGDITSIPDVGTPQLKLVGLDGSDAPEGICLEEGVVSVSGLPEGDVVTGSFLQAASVSSQWILRIEPGFSSQHPVVLDIDLKGPSKILHLSLDVGRLSELELITRVRGSGEWFGLLRTGEIGAGAVLNDVVVCLQDEGTLLRVDSIAIGRDAQVRVGTVSSGSERTKADLRYRMGEPGGNLRVLGSVLSADSMHIDHHVEIHHDAPETFSRLTWNSACGGDSRTVGTGMLRVADGSRGADAAQIFHNLLLSVDAEADSIPELEVLEHEVVGCGHGTANGPIDENQLFYLECRGFDPSDARGALIAAFLNSTLSEMGSDVLHDWLVRLLTVELESHDP
ncbi:MAG: SufD family Fe-S cluster assembly protein [Candidatus Thalassarchaeum betae]|nr:SufD family Fe-S cluster assembly protein [Candidatus Thalassoarchaea betae]